MESSTRRAGITRRVLLFGLPVGLGAAYVAGRLAWEHSLPTYVPPAQRVPPPPIEDEVRLLVLGDWGSAKRAQARVARGMESAAQEVGGVHAGIFLGDNFYNHGVSGTDDPQWQTTFEQVYDTEHLGLLTWHAVLGNHDYDGNPQAQVAYTDVSNGRWHMPASYFRVDLPDAEAPIVTILALDTNRQFDGWDAQLVWLDEQLEALARAPQPVLALGHHPLVSYCRKSNRVERQVRERLGPRLDGTEVVDLYLSGHAHNLEVIDTGTLRQALLGGGGKRLHPAGEGPGSLFSLSTFGFGLVRARRNGLTLEIRDATGRILHTWERRPHHEAAGS